MKELSSNLTGLVTILHDGKYHDGTSVGEKLGITRSAVWKAINKLEDYGIEIDSIKGKGYALLDPLILLNKTAIKKYLNHKNIDIELFETIDSTNDYLKNYSQTKKTKVCLAEQQVQGKGRLNREWYSPFAQNIYFSCLYPSYKDLSEQAGLSLVVSLAVAKTLSEYGLTKNLAVKWPNDVICDHQKISGNLIEIQAETNGMCSVIIGIGINVNMKNNKKSPITQPWTSLREMTGEYIDRNELAATLMNHLFNYLEKFEQYGLSAFAEEWNAFDGLAGRTITLKRENKKITGVASGINQRGHLVIKTKEGGLEAFSSGDTTILK